MTPRLRHLADALRRADLLVSAAEGDPTLTALTEDSRKAGPGTLFLAVRGTQADGHAFAPAAVAAGAAALVVERPLGLGVPELVVRDGRLAALALARAWYGDPARQLTLIGVTGTNGKTTTTNIVRHLFNAAHDAAVIGTIGAFDGRGERVASTAGSLTTPGPVDLQATFAALRDRGVRTVAMETSSHALDQGRLDGLSFGAGLFTNLTHEHLDYHRTVEHYFAAKAKLTGLLGLDGVAITNADDPAWDALPALPPGRRLSFGVTRPADVRAEEVASDASGTSFVLRSRWGVAEVRIPLIGDFNLSNALGAAAAALALGRPLDEVVARLAGAPQVPGRMEILHGGEFTVLRDYMHTPDAYERVLATLRPLTRGRLVVLFGCGGDRDRAKRPEMGRIAAERADLVCLTTDNPRTEDPERIVADIVAGIPGGGGEKVVRIPDREEAIHAMVALLRPGDTLLLAGKGHETYQIYGREKVPFDEPSIVRDAVGRR
ncbi:MAG TPA: UDP-N-acetylmuramoyl-L-alanyl-D-glutamate--2,6-diaminopimelate ligase [Gemmatimonadales bacterium]|nr:UDP-N-acetylmuramoyl-L-alanyl-D-glutamate--2,6-diaminopimelate ligase [Gemmatimonadales bacterium]